MENEELSDVIIGYIKFKINIKTILDKIVNDIQKKDQFKDIKLSIEDGDNKKDYFLFANTNIPLAMISEAGIKEIMTKCHINSFNALKDLWIKNTIINMIKEQISPC